MKGPLSGVRVLALERAIAGPYGSMVLADLGAEVIKIEPPGSGDLSRLFPGPNHKGEPFYYLAFNKNKKSLALDIQTKTGKEIFYDLVKVSDVVWDNFSAGTMNKIGADYDTLKQINPKIICCSVSGYGQTGPYKDRLSFDVVAEAISGAMSITGEPGRPPVRYGAPIADEMGGLFGVIGVLSALVQRAQTGKGTVIDVSLLDGQISSLAYHLLYYFCSGIVCGPQKSGHLSLIPYGAFNTKEGYLAIGPCWPRICRVLGIEEIIDDPRFETGESRIEHREELEAIIQEAFMKEKAEDWLELLYVERIGAGPVNTLDKAAEDPQVLARRMIVEMEHPLGGRIKHVGNPVKMPESEEEPSAPPTLGQHNEEILVGLLKCSPEKLKRLKEEEEKRAEELLYSLFKTM
ncbi:MAG: CoA transferase [Deltaproteobacteria bacterium]|nr:CoA transferase [Deltaproteobacteria bacterium]